MLLQDGPGAWIGERWRPDVEVVPRLPLVDVEPSERRCLVWHFYDAACDAHVRQPRGGSAPLLLLQAAVLDGKCMAAAGTY